MLRKKDRQGRNPGSIARVEDFAGIEGFRRDGDKIPPIEAEYSKTGHIWPSVAYDRHATSIINSAFLFIKIITLQYQYDNTRSQAKKDLAWSLLFSSWAQPVRALLSDIQEREQMRTNVLLAIILIAVGIVAFVYQGITYTTNEKVVNIGPLQVTAEKTRTLPLPPIVGALALAGGVVLLVAGRKKTWTEQLCAITPRDQAVKGATWTTFINMESPMEKRILLVFVLAMILSLQTGLASGDNTEPEPVQKKIQMHDQQHISDGQPVQQQDRPAKISKEQEPAPVILRMKILKIAD
jgi:hypothetical protein